MCERMLLLAIACFLFHGAKIVSINIWCNSKGYKDACLGYHVNPFVTRHCILSQKLVYVG